MATLKQFRLAELAELTQSTLVGNPDHMICGVDALEHASSQEASFLANARYRETMERSNAGVICIGKDQPLIQGKNFLISDDPSRAFQIIVEAFLLTDSGLSGFMGIHPTAVIHPTAKLGKDVQVGPYAVIDAGCEIQDGARIGPFVLIGAGAFVG